MSSISPINIHDLEVTSNQDGGAGKHCACLISQSHQNYS